MNIIDNFILIRKKFIKDEIIFLKLLYELILGLRDPDSAVQANNAKAIKSLIEAGLITPAEVKERIPLDDLISGLHDLRSYRRVGSAEAIKSLAKVGLVTPAAVRAFNLNKKEVEKVFLEVYGRPISYDFYYYYLSLLAVFRDNKDAVYRIFDYLQKDLVELLYICTNSMIENFFCQKLAQIIKEGKSVSQAKNILEEELQDEFTRVIIDSKGLRY